MLGGDVLAALAELAAAAAKTPPSRAVVRAVVTVLVASGQVEAAARVSDLATLSREDDP